MTNPKNDVPRRPKITYASPRHWGFESARGAPGLIYKFLIDLVRVLDNGRKINESHERFPILRGMSFIGAPVVEESAASAARGEEI